MSVDQPAAPGAVLPRAPRRSRWRLLLACGLCLAAGAVSGAGATLVVLARHAERIAANPDQWPGRLERRVNALLDLRPEQRERIGEIIRARFRSFERVRAEVRPQLMRELDALQAEIRAELDESQAARWTSFMTEARRRFQPPAPAL